ncbi:MAG: GAF domain-containing protein [Acidobacteria bacterium]|nr:GAF domain-containing protein [Acidobacteriota bacterium]
MTHRGRSRWALHVPALLFVLLLAVFFAIHHARDRAEGGRFTPAWAVSNDLVWLALTAFGGYLVWRLVLCARAARHGARLAAAREQEILDGVPDPVLVVDSDGRIERTNVALLELAGISPVLGMGTSLEDLSLRDEGGRPLRWPTEGHLRAYMGPIHSPMDVDVSVRPVPGHPELRLVHIHDLSRELADLRRITRQQEELRVLADLGHELNRVTTESELLEVAMDHVARRISVARAGGIFIVDRIAGVLRLSTSYGLDPAFVAAEQEVPLGECLCGEVAVSGKPLYSGSSAGDVFHSRQRHAAPHGHLVVPLRGDSGVFGVLFLYLREGAEVDFDWHRLLEGVASEVGLAFMRVRAHAALSESEGRLKRLFDEAPDAMLVADLKGVVLRVNLRAQRWFAVGEDVTSRFPWTSLSASGDGGRRPLRANVTDRLGHEGILEIAASPASTGEVQLILRDITREVALERKAQELQKMQVVGALSAGLAHNLNNIFASVLAHLCQLRDIVTDTTGIDLSLRGGDLEFGRRHLNTAIAGAEQVSVLIERLLEFARPREAHTETLDLGLLLQEQIELAKPLLGPLVEIEAHLPMDVNVTADRSIVVNALMNLLLNAAEAMSKKGRLSVTMGTDESGAEAWFAVEDTGVGMDQARLSRIFEPFFTTRSAGTGLGLSTLHAGITSLGGRVEVQSEPAEGSTFTVFLPRAAGSRRVEAPEIPARSHRIVLAEDASVLRRFTARFLEESGWEVRAVATVRELASVSAAWRPAVALVDWNLADGDVAGALDNLRQLGSKVIVLTGDPAAVTVKDVPVLTKPVDWNRLEKALLTA